MKRESKERVKRTWPARLKTREVWGFARRLPHPTDPQPIMFTSKSLSLNPLASDGLITNTHSIESWKALAVGAEGGVVGGKRQAQEGKGAQRFSF